MQGTGRRGCHLGCRSRRAAHPPLRGFVLQQKQKGSIILFLLHAAGADTPMHDGPRGNNPKCACMCPLCTYTIMLSGCMH